MARDASNDAPIPADADDCAVNRVRFLTAGRPERNRVRPAILASWERSREHGIAADRVRVPFLNDPEADTPLTRSADPVLTRLSQRLSGQAVSIILTDPAGVVLSRRTPDTAFERQLDHVLLAPGFTYAERFAGTNGIGVALATRRPTQVLGHEHYAENLERLACVAAPIHHPVTGRLAGVLDLTCRRGDAGEANAFLLSLVEATAEQIQQAMLAASCPAELAVLAAYRQTCHRSDDVVLAVTDGTVLLNDRARRDLDAADQSALAVLAGELAGGSRPGHRRTVDTVLSGGRPARVHCLPVGTAHRTDGAVLRVRVGAPPAEPHRPAARTAAERAGLPGLVGESMLWHQLVGRARDLHRAGTWLALRGEPGTGKTALALALARLRPDRRTVVLDARDPSGWPQPLAPAVAAARQLIVTHADEPADPGARLLADLLDAREPVNGWVVLTVGPAAGDVPGTLLDRVPHVLDVPALRLRPDDIPGLALHLLDTEAGTAPLALSPDALRLLVRAAWPGNVAQLRTAMRHARSRRRTGLVERSDLPADLHTSSRRALTPLESMERDAIVVALADAAGNKAAAAHALGISRATIYRRIHEYGIHTR